MCSLRDISDILRRYNSKLLHDSSSRILHLFCGDGEITFEYLSSFFNQCKEIIGIDSSDELIHSARSLHSKELIQYRILDITHDSQVEEFRRSCEPFTKVVCFCSTNWFRNSRKILKNIRSLMTPDAECFFALVGSTPVYDTYSQLARDPRWSIYMQDCLFIPFTDILEDSRKAFKTLMTKAGFEVLDEEIMEPVILRPTEETLNGHIRAVNHFIAGIPKAQQADFIQDCRQKISDAQEVKCLRYKIIVTHAKNTS